jgi:hypothetical protein
MLIATRRRRKEKVRARRSYHPCDREIVRGGRIQTAIASQIEKLDPRAEPLRRFSRFCFSFFRRAIRACFAAGTNAE